jgi:alcohol dehydrogenase YqhD (iron-dependent ADH family)
MGQPTATSAGRCPKSLKKVPQELWCGTIAMLGLVIGNNQASTYVVHSLEHALFQVMYAAHSQTLHDIRFSQWGVSAVTFVQQKLVATSAIH